MKAHEEDAVPQRIQGHRLYSCLYVTVLYNIIQVPW